MHLETWFSTALAAASVASPAAAQRSVLTVPVERISLERDVKLVGTVLPRAQADLVPRATGVLAEMAVEEGQVVALGTPCARLAAPDLAAAAAVALANLAEARAEVDLAAAEVGRARSAAVAAEADAVASELGAEAAARELTMEESIVARHRTLRAANANTEEDLEMAEARAAIRRARHAEARARTAALHALARAAEAQVVRMQAGLALAQASAAVAEAQLEESKVRASFAEVSAPYESTLIARRLAEPGALVEAGRTAVLRVMDATTVRVRIHIPERDAPHVLPGSRCTVALDARPSAPIDAAVAHVSSALDPQTRTMPAEILLANGDGAVLAGMFARVSVSLGRTDALVVQAAAVRAEGRRLFVWSVADGRATKIAVEVGRDDGRTVEITLGLRGDERVILDAPADLGDGDAVRVIEREGTP